MRKWIRLELVIAFCLAVSGADFTACAAERVRSGLLALYDFSSPSGNIVKDRSGAGKPLDLKIGNSQAVRRGSGTLQIIGKTVIQSGGPARKLIDAVRRSGELTVEAWIHPSSTSQEGPARIVTLSKNSNERDFTLGQDKDRYDARLRTTQTSTNGIPSLASSARQVRKQLSHVVYTRDRGGRARVFVNGRQTGERRVGGATSNWNASYQLALGNELSGDRPWLGTIHLVAIYQRALSSQEVEQNFRAGAAAKMSPKLAADLKARTFETRIAPILANHCLECHDSASNKGKLDLSRKISAFAGGENGKVIIPGKADASLLWESVAADEMPADRPSLSSEEKKLLKQWIQDGAVWSIDVIDPVVYAHERRARQAWVQRLTVVEYIETVRSSVGVDIAKQAREILPPDLRADGFSNTAYNLNVDLKHIDALARLAELIVERMDIKKFAARFSRSRRFTDDDMGKLISSMGKWLLRGPLDEHEIIAYRGISTSVASAGGSFEDAVGYIVQAMLQSPRFVYRVENQRGDGSSYPVGPYELASRLSYIIWGAPPDLELMRAAESGELAGSKQITAQVRRMLPDSRALERSKRFVYDWINLGRLNNLRPNSKMYPKWDRALAADMREETLAFFEDVVWKQGRPLSHLLNAQLTYATPRLAVHYGLKPQGRELAKYDVTSIAGRGGLLTHGSVLTIGGDEASMVSRGLFVLHDLLRGVVKDPPPCVDVTPVPTKSGLTQRGIAESRIANASCGGCHARFEPLAFGLEKFDGLGSYREQDEHGNKLREDGNILIPGSAKQVAYSTSAELMDLLASSERLSESITWKLTQFSLGRPLTAADARTVSLIHKAAQEGGGTYESTMTAIVLSDLVRMTRTEPAPRE